MLGMYHGIFKNPTLGASADVWEHSPDYERFEEQLVQALEEEFTSETYGCLKRRIFEFDDGTEICPDAVVVVQATDPPMIECVADAKMRKELRPEHVRKVLIYKTRLQPNYTRIYVPPTCTMSLATKTLAEENGIEIRKSFDPFSQNSTSEV